MKKINIFIILSTFMFLIISCNNSDRVLSPTENDASTINVDGFGKRAVVQSVSGSGNFTDANGDFRTFSFNAKLHTDETVSGQWERVNHRENASESKSHGKVTCFTIDGNQAWLGGYATSGVLSEAPNNEVGWRVVDNGQDNNADPDQISLQAVGRVPGTASFYCEGKFETPVFNDVAAGDIQIK